MPKKILIIVSSILTILVLGFCGYLYSLKVKIDNGDLVKWDNVWYTKEALEQIIPPQVYEVESKNTPEEVYTKFREALLKDDIESALELIKEEKKNYYRESFIKSLDSYKKIPELKNIKKSEKNSFGNFANYYYDSNEKDGVPYEIFFIKNRNGYWEIDGI